MARVPMDPVLTLFDEGAASFAALASALPEEAWQQTACGAWTATQLARHLCAVIEWYHEWLDRAEAGDATAPFAVSELAERNEAALLAKHDLSGPEAVARFVARAGAYRHRVAGRWDLPFGYPRGTVTAGLHAGVAACEWHLHSWDLARSRGIGHRPSDPATLCLATGLCLATARGGVSGRVQAAFVPLVARARPWETILRRSGRVPAADD